MTTIIGIIWKGIMLWATVLGLLIGTVFVLALTGFLLRLQAEARKMEKGGETFAKIFSQEDDRWFPGDILIHEGNQEEVPCLHVDCQCELPEPVDGTGQRVRWSHSGSRIFPGDPTLKALAEEGARLLKE